MNETISSVSQEAHIELIGSSGLLDENYYANNNPEVQLPDLVEDYYFLGSKKGTNPSFLFNTQYYLNKNPDVAENNIRPLVHYIKSGEYEGRSPSVFVDLEHLKKQIPGEINSTYLAYFYSNEIELELSAHPYFDCKFYLANNPDVAESGISPYHHFIACGAYEGRNPREDINFSAYLSEHDVNINVENPFKHFLLNSNFVEKKEDSKTATTKEIEIKDNKETPNSYKKSLTIKNNKEKKQDIDTDKNIISQLFILQEKVEELSIKNINLQKENDDLKNKVMEKEEKIHKSQRIKNELTSNINELEKTNKKLKEKLSKIKSHLD